MKDEDNNEAEICFKNQNRLEQILSDFYGNLPKEFTRTSDSAQGKRATGVTPSAGKKLVLFGSSGLAFTALLGMLTALGKIPLMKLALLALVFVGSPITMAIALGGVIYLLVRPAMRKSRLMDNVVRTRRRLKILRKSYRKYPQRFKNEIRELDELISTLDPAMAHHHRGRS